MKKSLPVLALEVILGISLAGCIGKPYTCTDPLGCVTVKNAASIKIGSLLTMTGPDSAYGIDALRGVEIAIADKKQVFGHPVELVKVDDLCTAEGGTRGANQLAANPDITGVIGTTCSSASIPAADILTKANMVLISPSSTAPSLTDPAQHQVGFLRTIYNDQVQGRAVAEFAFNILGVRRMLTVHDGTAYPKQLQQAACDSFETLGGDCVAQIDLSSGQKLATALDEAANQDPDVIYFPLYTEDGVALINAIPQAGFSNPALISSDGLLSADFIQKAGRGTEGMYLSGPADVKDSADFAEKYMTRYGEDPIASYRLQAYDAATMLFAAIEKVAVPISSADNSISIPRKALRDALYATHGMQGLSGPISCSPTGDCARPNIEIFQVVDQAFKPIYP
jgi:branched-chain amino acid transport system substrate-binding protein